MDAKKFTLAILACLVTASRVAVAAPPVSTAGTRTVMAFDSDWRFLKADATGAEQNQFADSAWRKLDLPHDWSIEGPFAETNPASGAGAFLPSGVGWYRKHFSPPKNLSDRSVSIQFDGVMQNSDVWINGFHLGHRPFGYVGFSYELTGHLNFGGDNVLAVRADTSVQPASRWYAGAGIYRHVRLVATDPVHFAENGVFVSTPKISAAEATVRIETTVTNESAALCEITIQTSLVSPDGKTVGAIESSQTVSNGAAANLEQQIVFPQPQLWNLDDPKLYHAVSQVRADGKILDELATAFGIRDAHFEADTGFWLNGKNFKVKGACLHEDGGAFGMAVPLAVWEMRLKNLKALGVNAIRTAHNPPAPEFLDLCDRMGLLVMDEMFDCWTVAKPTLSGQKLADYHLYFNEWSLIDLRDTVRRDRNHPSIILYSAGNEIHDTPNAELAKKILSGLVAAFHENDPTRPVTQALLRPNASHDYDDGLADLLDVVGQNYRENEILAAHAQKPSRKIIGTENHGERATWTMLRDNAPYAGQFLWSAVDYLGESRNWPTVGAASGLLDRTAATKPASFERRSWWSDQPMVSIARRTSATQAIPADPGFAPLDRRQVLFADWTPQNLQPHNENVEVYSNCKKVELFLNGKSLGAKTINANAAPRIWDVPFAPGTLMAVASNEGKILANDELPANDELRTAGSPAKIVLSTDTEKLSPGWDDVAFVRAKVVDAKGVETPRAGDLISFTISGPGIIAAVDNADNASHELFQSSKRHAFQGECVAFVRATGTFGRIVVQASAPGLGAGSISIKAGKPSL